jgi:hypothetical protein
VNGDHLTRRLLDSAVPPIPARLAEPPLARIRQRARHRQLAVIGSAAAAAVLVLGIAGVATANWRQSASPDSRIGSQHLFPQPSNVDSDEPSTSDSAGPAGVGTRGPAPWQIVQVDRAGTTLTVYVEPPAGDCRVYNNAKATLDERSDAVNIAVTATPGPGPDCTTAWAATLLTVHLAKTLGTRPVRDHGTTRPAFLDRELPLVPAPWTKVSEGYGGFGIPPGWDVGYTRPGGPDIHIQAHTGTVTRTPLKQVTIGSRTGITFADGSQVGLQWQVGSLVYTLVLMPTEGATSSPTELDDVLSHLHWSQ